MKVLHTADWHIGQFKGPVEDGVNLRSLDTVKCLEYMVEKAKEEKPDLVCISGDVFHQEQIGPVRYSDEMVTATRIIDELSKVSKFVVVMRGTPNHDGAGQFRVLTKMLEHNKKVAVVKRLLLLQRRRLSVRRSLTLYAFLGLISRSSELNSLGFLQRKKILHGPIISAKWLWD